MGQSPTYLQVLAIVATIDCSSYPLIYHIYIYVLGTRFIGLSSTVHFRLVICRAIGEEDRNGFWPRAQGPLD